MYRHPPETPQQRAERQQEMAALGIADAAPAPEPVVFWQEHEAALIWWLQVQDLMRWTGPVCEGLDLAQVQADIRLSGRAYSDEDYARLRLISRVVADCFNQRQ